MIKTIKELKEKVLKNPGKYGRKQFFRNKKPYCPIAVEIIPDECNNITRFGYVEEASKRLGCTRKEVWKFIKWWDSGARGNHEKN